jgi:hypothetical protein
MSIKGVGKVVVDIENKILKVFVDAVNMHMDPNSTDADREKSWKAIDDVGAASSQEAVDAAHAEAKEGAIKRLTGGGMSATEAEEWIESRWKRLVTAVEKARKTAPKAKDAGRFVWLKVIAAVAAVGWIATAITGAHAPRTGADRMYDSLRAQTTGAAQMDMFLSDAGQFDSMIAGLKSGSAPRHAADSPQITAQAAALPPAVADVAEQAVDVEVKTPAGTSQVSTTLGQAYRYVPPPAQRQIERTVQRIDHGYDHENMNDCAHTHCLGGSFHKDFTVDSPIGSAHFRY